MTWKKAGKIALAVALYLLTYGVLDGLIHWWEMIASPVPNPIALGSLLVFTAAYVWIAWRILRNRT